MQCSTPPAGTHSHHHTHHIPFPPFLSKSEFWSLLHTVLKKCVHRTIHSRFFFAQDPSPDLHALAPHLGYHAVHHASDASSQQSLPFEVTSTATLPATGSLTSIGALPTDGWAESPHHLSHFATSFTTTPLDPYSDHVTAVNATETYGVPVGVMDQSTTISSISNPVVIEQKRWYTEYNVDRDANGLFHCPFAECSKQNKRRDQLWEHWKGKHNNDPYRCSFWSVLPCKQVLFKRSNSKLSRKTWIYNGEKAHSCNTEMTICQIWFVDIRCAWRTY